MYIRKIKINNFKSLVNFELDLAPFNCLIGLNGSGKSTVLQAIDFLAELIRGDVKGWLKKRRWRAEDLSFRLIASNRIELYVEFARSQEQTYLIWSGEYDVIRNYCPIESIETKDIVFSIMDDVLIKHAQLDPSGHDIAASGTPILWRYQGSIFSSLTPKHPFFDSLTDLGVVNFLKTTQSFDMLSPYLLRRRIETHVNSVGIGGENFSAYLFGLNEDKRHQILEKLQSIYPNLRNLIIEPLTSGRKRFKVAEQFKRGVIVTEAQHVNDGLLRMTALLSILEGNQSFLLFDELENGINPELVLFVISALTQAKQQIMVTTHSPMILNYLEDDLARQGVIYLDKTDEGITRATPFFKIPSVARKLEVMGPGEAFVDTDLIHLGAEIDQVVVCGYGFDPSGCGD